MKNVQVVDGTPNTTFDIFALPDPLFDVLFPGNADVAFFDEAVAAVERRGGLADAFWRKFYSHRVEKKSVNGVQGTLHLQGSHVVVDHFPSRRESDVWPARVRVDPSRQLPSPSEPLRNVQIYDGATNATFGVVGVPARLFEVLFPGGADVAFLSLVPARLRGNGARAAAFWSEFYSFDLDKRLIVGIHGTLHYDSDRVRPEFFPRRREADVSGLP
jgi:hypothetical protein